MTQMDTDKQAPRMHAIKGRRVFAFMQEAVTAHDDHHPPSCQPGYGWLPSSAFLRVLCGRYLFFGRMGATRV